MNSMKHNTTTSTKHRNIPNYAINIYYSRLVDHFLKRKNVLQAILFFNGKVIGSKLYFRNVLHSYFAFLSWIRTIGKNDHHANVLKIYQKMIIHRSYRDVLTKKKCIYINFPGVCKLHSMSELYSIQLITYR